jgi:uncharacterized protein YbjT (DUF2867 family)
MFHNTSKGLSVVNKEISSIKDQLILVTGATGYVGARLTPRLLKLGYKVRASSRSTIKLQGRSWSNHPNLEIASADLLDKTSLTKAISGCTCIFYLVHSMNSEHKDFASADRLAAYNLMRIAEAEGVKRIIYLGGLGEEDSQLSKHLRSRSEVGKILCSGNIPITILRAAMIIGSGSASFEILRYLVDRLPIMITPKWVRTPSQPIAIRNVLEYLTGCLEHEETIGQTFDIGGPDILTYQQLMDLYAEEAGLGRRLVFPVPFFTPRLSSYWIHFVTPVPAYIARPLADGLRNPAICKENNIRALMPLNLIDCHTAINLAIENTQHQTIESHWTDAGKMLPDEWNTIYDPKWAGGTVYEDKRSITIACSADHVWPTLIKIGGKTGWYYGNWLWKLRGFIDKLFGGVGLSRGRRNADTLLPGDALDFWRVYAVENAATLVLVAEMKLPGRAVLIFQIIPIDKNKCEIRQIAKFMPFGLTGIIYWKLVSPLHDIVFNGILRGIAETSNQKIIVGPIKLQ